MPRLLTGIDWIDHRLISRPEPSEPSEEKGEGESSDEENQDSEPMPLDERCWWLRESRKRFKPFWWAEERTR